MGSQRPFLGSAARNGIATTAQTARHTPDASDSDRRYSAEWGAPPRDKQTAPRARRVDTAKPTPQEGGGAVAPFPARRRHRRRRGRQRWRRQAEPTLRRGRVAGRRHDGPNCSPIIYELSRSVVRYPTRLGVARLVMASEGGPRGEDKRQGKGSRRDRRALHRLSRVRHTGWKVPR